MLRLVQPNRKLNMQTYTPPGGNSPQNLQLNALQSTMQNIGPLPQPQQQAAQTAITTAQNAGQNVANTAQGVQQAAGTLATNANFNQVDPAYSDIQKQYQLFMHDMQAANGGQGIGTTATPTGGQQTMDPLTYGVQMGQSNPYYGSMFATGAINDAAKAASSTLGNAVNYNVGQFGTTLGSIKDIYAQQGIQQKNALDVLSTIITAAQADQQRRQQASQFEQTLGVNKASTVATLREAGLDDGQIQKLLGLTPDQMPSASGDNNLDTQAKNLAEKVRNGQISFSDADSLTVSNMPLKKKFEALMSQQGLGLGATPVAPGLSPVIAQTAEGLMKNLNNDNFSSGVLGIGRGSNVGDLLSFMRALHPTMNDAELQAKYLISPFDPQRDSKLAQIKNELQGFLSLDPNYAPSSTTTTNAGPSAGPSPSPSPSGDWKL